MRQKKTLLKLYILMGLFEGAVAFGFLLLIPADPRNAVFLGYSSQRLLLLGVFLAFFALVFLFFLQIQNSAARLEQSIQHMEGVLNSRRGNFIMHLVSLFLISLGIILLLLPFENQAAYFAFAERMSPVIFLGSAVGIQTLLGQFLWRNKKPNWHILLEWKSLFGITSAVFTLLLVLSAWVARSGIGLVPEKYGWHYPGAPILFSQLFVAWLFSLSFIFWNDPLEKWVKGFQVNHASFIRLDVIVCLALWLSASFIWWGEPMRKDSYFTPTPTPPNFEYYPHSDAAIYDLSAQNMLIGADQNNKIILRPLYVFMLTLFRMVGGQQYENVIFLQVGFLAVMPAIAYLLASMLGGRPAGLLIAILIILRERNGIALTNVIEISHSKLLMADVPTMVFMLLLIFVLVKWLKRPVASDWLGVFAGASFGMLMLVRSHQSVFIVPAILIGMAFSGGFRLKRALRRISVFALGFLVMAAPWIWRNHEVNGKLAIESSEFYISWYAGAYTEPTDTVDILPGETPDEHSSRIKRQVFQYILDHPVELARVYTSYFVRNEIASVLAMPVSLKLYDLRSYTVRMQYWNEPLLSFTPGSGLIFFITLGLITFGVGIAVKRLGVLGLVPLLIHFTFNFSMSLARISGWRFVQPVDWILQLYYCIGLVTLTVLVIALISSRVSGVVYNREDGGGSFDNPSAALGKCRSTLLVFIFLGISLPLTEILIPQRYSEMDTDQRLAEQAADGLMLENGTWITAAHVESFLETEPAAVVLYGRALYPLFYEQGKYWGSGESFSLLVGDLDRLQFTYIGSENAQVFIQRETPPDYFPNAADVFIIGCRERAGIRALAVEVNDRSPIVAKLPWQGLTCSID